MRRSLEGVRPVRIRTKCLYNMWRGVFIVCSKIHIQSPPRVHLPPFPILRMPYPPQSTISLEVIQWNTSGSASEIVPLETTDDEAGAQPHLSFALIIAERAAGSLVRGGASPFSLGKESARTSVGVLLLLLSSNDRHNSLSGTYNA